MHGSFPDGLAPGGVAMHPCLSNRLSLPHEPIESTIHPILRTCKPCPAVCEHNPMSNLNLLVHMDARLARRDRACPLINLCFRTLLYFLDLILLGKLL